MLVIKSVETQEVEGFRVRYDHKIAQDILLAHADPRTRPLRDIETVTGQYFIDKGGKRQVIGLTAEVREVLGLPLDWVTEYHKTLDEARERITEYKKTLDEARERIAVMRSAPLLTRIKWVFKGVTE